MSQAWREGPACIYDEAYAAAYPALYGHRWRVKHAHNASVLQQLFGELAARRSSARQPTRWLDVACGQGWQLASAPAWVTPFGLDLSTAQLARACRNAPRAHCVRADMTTEVFRPGRFSLITSFWAAYAYLDDETRIAAWLDRLTSWLEPGGCLYLEVLLPEDLASFNDSDFAAGSGFRVRQRSTDWVRWAYDDSGGEHLMTSPLLSHLRARLEPCFERLETEHDGSFMTHLVARGRQAD